MSLATTAITKDSVGPPLSDLGLSQREADERLRQVGSNDPSPRKRGALLIELLVLFVIRTAGNPLKSRPSAWLTLNTLAVVAVGLALPWSPLARLLGFTALPLPFLLFLGISTITYLLLVEGAKRKFFAVSRKQAETLAGSTT
jgi:hypothetical protein